MQKDIEKVSVALRATTQRICANLEDKSAMETYERKINFEIGWLKDMLDKTMTELETHHCLQQTLSTIRQIVDRSGKIRNLLAREKANHFAIRRLEQGTLLAIESDPISFRS